MKTDVFGSGFIASGDEIEIELIKIGMEIGSGIEEIFEFVGFESSDGGIGVAELVLLFGEDARSVTERGAVKIDIGGEVGDVNAGRDAGDTINVGTGCGVSSASGGIIPEREITRETLARSMKIDTNDFADLIFIICADFEIGPIIRNVVGIFRGGRRGGFRGGGFGRLRSGLGLRATATAFFRGSGDDWGSDETKNEEENEENVTRLVMMNIIDG